MLGNRLKGKCLKSSILLCSFKPCDVARFYPRFKENEREVKLEICIVSGENNT